MSMCFRVGCDPSAREPIKKEPIKIKPKKLCPTKKYFNKFAKKHQLTDDEKFDELCKLVDYIRFHHFCTSDIEHTIEKYLDINK